jgi:predicted dehydrogenase
MVLNCAIIGMGIGEKHLKTLLTSVNVKILFICDFNEKKLNLIKSRYKDYKKLNNCVFTTNFKDILKSNKLNFTIISSFDNFHANQIIACAKKKINIFVEKPMCQNKKDLIKINNALQKYKVSISSNFVLRENPIFKKLKKNIMQNKLGDIYHFETEYNYGRQEKIHYGWRKDIPYYSVNQGGSIHVLDLIFFLKKQIIKSVYTVGNNICSKKSHFKHPDTSVSVLKFKDGSTAQITANFSSVTPHHHKLSVYGTKASFEYNYFKNVYFFSRDNQKKLIKIEKNIKKYNKSVVLKDYIKLLLKNDKRSLKKKKDELLYNTKVILMMDKSMKTNN